MCNTIDNVFEKIIEYIKLGEYIKAYELSLKSECDDKNQMNELHCFRVLLACINNEIYLPTYEFKWNLTSSNDIDLQLNHSKMKNNINCYSEMFKELKNLCYKHHHSKN